MRIGVLSQSATLHSTRRLLESIEAAGHEAVALPLLRCRLLTRGGPTELSIEDEHGQPIELTTLDAVITRIGSYLPELGLATARAFERAGIPVVNSAAAIEVSRDKQRAAEVWARNGEPLPATCYLQDYDQLEAAIGQVGGVPLIVKPTIGSQGTGVVLAENVGSAVAAAELLLSQRRSIVLQRFVEESRGEDRRLFVVGDSVVAAVKRIAADHEFRANRHRGGRVERFTPDPDTAALAVRAARSLGLEIAGIDLLVSSNGPLLLEANASPGLEGVEAGSGVDVAAAVVAHVAAACGPV